MTTIHLVSSGKGNVGKSAFASVMNCIGIAAGANPQLIDADDQKQTLSKLHGKQVQLISMSDDPAFESQPDAIWYLAERNQRDVIADLAAQADVYINRWIDNRDVVSTAKQNDIRIIKWWVCDLDPNSLDEVARLSQAYGPDEITHVLVKSYYRARPELWESAISSNTNLKAAIKGNLQVIEFPKLFGTLVGDLREKKLTFKDIVLDEEHKKIDMLNRSTVLKWVELCRAEIETVYKFQETPVPAGSKK